MKDDGRTFFVPILRIAILLLVTLFFVFLTFAPWPLPWLRAFFMPLPLLVVGFWVLVVPQFFTLRWSFAVGVLHDILAGHMLGLYTLPYMLIDMFLRNRGATIREQGFVMEWTMMALGAMLVVGLQWLAALFFQIPVNPIGLLMGFLPGVILYPALRPLLLAVAQALPEER